MITLVHQFFNVDFHFQFKVSTFETREGARRTRAIEMFFLGAWTTRVARWQRVGSRAMKRRRSEKVRQLDESGGSRRKALRNAKADENTTKSAARTTRKR